MLRKGRHYSYNRWRIHRRVHQASSIWCPMKQAGAEPVTRMQTANKKSPCLNYMGVNSENKSNRQQPY